MKTIYSLSDCMKAVKNFDAEVEAETKTDDDYVEYLNSLPFGICGDIASAADRYGSGDQIHYHQNQDDRISSFVQYFLNRN